MKMEKNKSWSPIPIIDLQGFELGPEEFNKLREACEEWGCFRILNHKVPLTLVAEMKCVVRSFLDLPGDIKRRNPDGIAGTGYVEPTNANPLYESLGLFDFGSSQAVLDFCSRLEASSYQREVMEVYSKAIHELLLDLAKKVGESLGLAGYDPFREWPCQYWFNKYNFIQESLGSQGLHVHTDYGFLTILQEDDTVGGLEIMDKSDNVVVVDPFPGTFLVLVGDIAKAWSNGRLRTVKHRVQCKEESIRVSIASFLLAPMEKVEAPPEFVDLEHPRLYTPFVYEEYRKLRFSTGMRTGEMLDLLRIKP